MHIQNCPFCQINDDEIILKNNLVFAFYDKFPVNPGHLLIVPFRHFSSFFEAEDGELAAIHDLVLQGKSMLDGSYRPDGYNIGVNVGKPAGQTIFHLHVHLIPRYVGDVEEPKGGVRGVIPEKQRY